MAQKKLQKDSEYAHLDIDGDGVVTDDELDLDERMMRLENEDKKEEMHRCTRYKKRCCNVLKFVKNYRFI